jgi:Tfp pilus assembly protein FimT
MKPAFQCASAVFRPALDPGAARPHSKKKAAFTLMELLLVVGIVLVISGVSLPLFLRSTDRMRMKLSARTVHQMHRFARSRALLSGVPRVLKFDLDGNRVEFPAQPGNVRILERGVRLTEFNIGPSELSEGVAEVTYNASGRCPDYTVQLQDEEGAVLTVSIDGIAGRFVVEAEAH